MVVVVVVVVVVLVVRLWRCSLCVLWCAAPCAVGINGFVQPVVRWYASHIVPEMLLF